ncbi:MAG TPA: ABC transporter permease, partial [Solirubrobacterales bacterium]|nr:ABC transporter permease [Solirubrobacterales bacterium]
MTLRGRPLRHYLEAYAFLGLLVAAAVFFSVWPETSETFPSAANLRTLVGANSVIAIVALAALVPLVAYEFDLSVGAVAGLSSVFVATALASATSIALGVALGIGLGILVGTINALLITRV